MKNVIVIHEIDGHERLVIGVASTREKALDMIKEYYGEHVMTDFKDVIKNNIDFSCRVETEGEFGGTYYVIGENFHIDSIN